MCSLYSMALCCEQMPAGDIMHCLRGDAYVFLVIRLIYLNNAPLFYVYSMIEMMEGYMKDLEKCLNKKNANLKLVRDEVTVNLNGVQESSSGELTNFTDRRMAVMMISMDSAAAESLSNCCLVEIVRELAMSVTGQLVVVEETPNSMILLFGTNMSSSTGSHVVKLVMLARQVIGTVRKNLNTGN